METKQQWMEWRHSGSPRAKNSECKSAGKYLAAIFWDQESILTIDYLPKGQTIKAEYYSSMMVQLKDILKETPAGSSPSGSCSCATRLKGTCNPEETGLSGLPMSWSPTLFSGYGPVGLPPVPWTEKTIERWPIFVRRGGHCWRGDLVGRTKFWICLSGLQTLEQRA